MPSPYLDKQARLEAELAALSRLHPDYSRGQLEECRENFLHYLDFVWKIFERMKADGRLNKLLTDSEIRSRVTSKDYLNQQLP